MKNAARFWFFIAAILTISPCFGQSCGAVQSLTPPQKNQVAILRSQLEAALVQEKLSAIDSLNNLLKAAFGPEGGKPDAVESYYNLVGATSWPNLPSTVALSRQLISSNSTTYADLWKMAKGMAPPAYQPHSIFLRTSAETAVGLLRIADKETDPARKAQYQAWANRALDSLATMQLPSGAFPFPDLRPYGDPVFSSIIKKYLTSLGADSSLVLVRGWIIDDRNSGEFKFDAGVIGNAYYEAYNYTGNVRYRSIALSVANYMLPLKMSANYNYNTFVSLALTRGFQLTNDPRFLNRALLTLRYGLYPGQLANGRWVDGHNANSRYHNLILCNIIPTINLIPATSLYKAALDGMTVRALQNLMSYSGNCGSATGFRWLLAAYALDSTLYPAATRRQINDLIGRHLNQAMINGKYLDVQSLGLYTELLRLVALGTTTDFLRNTKSYVFPNPFTEQANVIFELSKAQEVKVSLYNSAGKLVRLMDSGNKSKGTYSYTISGANLNPGLYMVVVQSDTGKFSCKLLKK